MLFRSVVQIGGLLIHVARLQAEIDAALLALDVERAGPREGGGQRLRAAHAAQAGGEDDAERAVRPALDDQAVKAAHGARFIHDFARARDVGRSDCIKGVESACGQCAMRNNPLMGTEIRKGEDWPKLPDGKPDFNKMTSSQRQAYDAARLKRIYG